MYIRNTFIPKVSGGVADPDPPDPHVFGLPGYGSPALDPDPDPSIILQK